MGEAYSAFMARGGHTGFWWRKPGERDHLKELGIDWKIILMWIFNKWDGGQRLN